MAYFEPDWKRTKKKMIKKRKRKKEGFCFGTTTVAFHGTG
jgi:hypothetical protein